MKYSLAVILFNIIFCNHSFAQKYEWDTWKIRELTTDAGRIDLSSMYEVEYLGLVKVRIKNSVGWLDYKSGKTKIPIIYDGASGSFKKDLAFAAVGKEIEGITQYGIIDPKGEFIVQPKYDKIKYWGNDLWEVRKNGKHGLMDINEKMALNFSDFTIPYFGNEPNGKKKYIIKTKKDKVFYGFMDKNGKILAPPIFSAAEEKYFKPDANSVLIYYGYKGECDEEGFRYRIYKVGEGWLTPNCYDKVSYNYSEKHYHIKSGVKEGIVYADGTETWTGEIAELVKQKELESKYDVIGELINGYKKVIKSGKVGFINSNDELIIPLNYEAAFDINKEHGLVGVQKAGKQGFINLKNEEIIPIKFDKVYRINNNLIRVTLGNSMSLYRTNGTIIIDKCTAIDKPLKGSIRYKKNGFLGLLDITGKSIIPNKYLTLAAYFSEGLVYAENQDGKMGYLDTNNTMVIPFKFYNVGNFKKGQALAYETEDSPLRVINKKGEFTLTFGEEFTGVYLTDSKDRFFVKRGEYFALCNRTGEVLMDFRIKSVQTTVDGDFEIDTKYGKGLVSATGRIVIPPAYKEITKANNGFYIVKRSMSNNDIYGSYTSQTKYGLYHWERGQVLGDYFHDIYITNNGNYGYQLYKGSKTSYAELNNWNDNPMYKFLDSKGRTVTAELKSKYKNKGIKIINNTDHSFNIYSRREGQTGADDAKEYSLPMGSTMTLDCHATANIYGVVSYGSVNDAKLLLDVTKGGYTCNQVILMSDYLKKLNTDLTNLHFIIYD